jgi:hypothetical protein
LELISRSVVCSLWGCHHIDWCLSASRGDSDGILRMWDRRFWRRSKSVWGNLLLPARLETLKMVSLGLLWVFMGLIPILIEGTYGRNWLVCLVGGIFRGALGETSTSPISLVKDRVKLVLVPLCWSSLFSL